MASVTFQNVTKRYGDVVAVDDATLHIEDNEFFCFFGPPLSGKSTLLRLILGLDRPDEGEILIDGKPVTTVPPAQRNVAMVFQNLALFPHMSARDNVAFPLVERGTEKDVVAARVADVSDKLHITHILHKPPAQLSGGERQRVAIARALVRDPVAYLMDDPISALDARLREETRVELKRIQRELGHTLIYVTHDQEEAMSVADRMSILDRGRIRQTGTPLEIYDAPNSTYVAQLLGSPVMNIMDCRENAHEDVAGGALRLAPGRVPDGTVELGVRPENIKVRAWDDSKDASGAEVFEVEPLGGHTVVTLNAGETRLRAVLRGQPDIRPGERVLLSCQPEQMHFFDAGGTSLRA